VATVQEGLVFTLAEEKNSAQKQGWK